jgi:hypothetical protein
LNFLTLVLTLRSSVLFGTSNDSMTGLTRVWDRLELRAFGRGNEKENRAKIFARLHT